MRDDGSVNSNSTMEAKGKRGSGETKKEDRQANVESGREASSSNRTREMVRTFEMDATATPI